MIYKLLFIELFGGNFDELLHSMKYLGIMFEHSGIRYDHA